MFLLFLALCVLIVFVPVLGKALVSARRADFFEACADDFYAFYSCFSALVHYVWNGWLEWRLLRGRRVLEFGLRFGRLLSLKISVLRMLTG